MVYQVILYYVTYYTVSYYIVSYHIILYCIITYHRPLIHYMKKASKTVDKVRWQLGPQPKPLFYLPSGLSAWKKKVKMESRSIKKMQLSVVKDQEEGKMKMTREGIK